jgi:outer membrane scaffolding protein for murein synthesis (MipA/OmpV family)
VSSFVTANEKRQSIEMIEISETKPHIIGIGVGLRTSIYKDGEDKVHPNLLYDNGLLFMRGTHVGYRYYTNRNWSLDAGIKAENFGYKHDDSETLKAVDGVGDIKLWTNAKLGAEYAWNSNRIRFELSHDLSGEHDGTMLDLEYSHSFKFGPLRLTQIAGIEWWSAEVTDYLIGLAESSPGTTFHKPDSMLHGYIGAQVLIGIAPHHAIQMRVKQKVLDHAVKESPLVDDDRTIQTSLIYVYRF